MSKNKYGHRKEFIDIEARNAFKMGKVATLMIKYSHRFNHYGLRETMINNNIVEAICPRCEKVETQDYVIKYEETISLRKEFIKDLVVELVKNKPDDVHVEQIMSFIEDILRYAKNEEKNMK